MFADRIRDASVLLGLAWSATAHGESRCLASPVSVRFPPTIANINPHWVRQPIGWDFGYWHQTNSSSANDIMRNLEYYTKAVDAEDPRGVRSELTSFQVPNSSTIYTSYGIDTPTNITEVYEYRGTGIISGATDFLQFLAWGTDCRGVQYRISYSTYTAYTGTPASLDVLSRTADGPDAETLGKITDALIAYGDEAITALANALVPAPYDGARDDLPPVQECDAYCESNEDLLELIGA
jgi:hypothetical protein